MVVAPSARERGNFEMGQPGFFEVPSHLRSFVTTARPNLSSNHNLKSAP